MKEKNKDTMRSKLMMFLFRCITMVKKMIIQQSFYIFKESLISAISSGVNSS